MKPTDKKPTAQQLIEELQAISTRSNGKCIMPKNVAIEILQAHGEIETTNNPSGKKKAKQSK